MKYILLILGVLLSSIVNANEDFRTTGTVNAQSIDGATVVINSQEYKLNLETVTHGLIIPGELGPLFGLGQVVSFKMKNSDNNTPYITEIWLQQ